MSKHTPGPWKTGRYETNEKPVGPIRIWGGDRGAVLADLPADYPQSEANARLIATAPDLLAALEALCDEVENNEGGKAYFNATKIIAKAKGEA
jgi:hypothetical protein